MMHICTSGVNITGSDNVLNLVKYEDNELKI